MCSVVHTESTLAFVHTLVHTPFKLSHGWGLQSQKFQQVAQSTYKVSTPLTKKYLRGRQQPSGTLCDVIRKFCLELVTNSMLTSAKRPVPPYQQSKQLHSNTATCDFQNSCRITSSLQLCLLSRNNASDLTMHA